MVDISNAKAMARTLRTSLSQRSIELPHSACLELVARQFGFADWNVLSARLEPPRRPLSLPKDWFALGSISDTTHRLGLDPERPGTALIESLVARGRGKDLTGLIAVLMQSIKADTFRGQRLRLSADLRTQEADLATIWMRVDGDERRGLAFDNMLDRETEGPLTGTTDWTRRSIVLDVAPEAGSLHYGVFLRGYGRVWARHVRIEPVGPETPVTIVRRRETCDAANLPGVPANLDFCER
ncbi:glyoxalase superfamily protein [Methylorubrum zatmanii]|uniref:Glyoxalase superfamily protein n=1 Tax=Methylorubrum zatmanii TaxID=29429 RepID=A0ABW1WN69_9HYPH|nr:glyoxalase superfamily protein [Methylorubrum zatmanii]MBD8906428.1 hypothetical protein [Methylorubrum zatmanii]